WRQFKLEEPIMNLRVLKYPLFLHAIAMFLIIVMTMFATEIILPVYMQTTMLVSAAVVGMAMLPGSLLNGFLSPFMGALFDKVGPRVMMIPATAVLSVVLYFYTKINPDTSVWMIVVGFALIMVSISATMMPAQTNGLNQLPKELYPHGSAVMSTLQPLGGAIGVSVFISILNSKKLAFLANNPGATENEAMTSAVEFVYTISFIGALLTFVLALFVRRAEPINLEEEK
ncbi:MAG TPA: MFS transporter, partial [Jeotgalicoccus sp.]|nr:MFS transporter [Jeotgalicoccus sp.]